MGIDLRHETRWHHKDGQRLPWELPELTAEETVHERHWTAAPGTRLRSSLLVRGVWMYWELNPVWKSASPAGGCERLQFGDATPPQTAAGCASLTVSEARIPGATRPGGKGVSAAGN
ncbi:hypothetical protein [Streptomyces mesophilus]|nr:hypothetical protein [Streptomyces mesophilus]